MIFEFALEPALVARWHDRKEYLFFEEKFGLTTGRMLSRYPKKWVALVWDAFHKGSCRDNQNAQKRLEALLGSFREITLKRKSTFPEISEWLVRAETEHQIRPFHAILATDNPRRNADVIATAELISRGHDRWQVPCIGPAPRDSCAFADLMEKILTLSDHLILVDPYLDPDKLRFRNTLEAFFEKIWIERWGSDSPEVELHAGIERFFDGTNKGASRSLAEERRVCKWLTDGLRNKLPGIIPEGKTVKVVIWKEREQGEKLHNRYVLSEVAGALFGIGLDECEDDESAETDDVVRLSQAHLNFRWKQFSGTTPAFDMVCSPLEIAGRKRS